MNDRDSYSQSMLPPKVKEAMEQSPHSARQQSNKVGGRPFPREQQHSPRTAPQTKPDANIRYLMPIYSFVIVMLFAYTIYRLFLKKKSTLDRDANDERVDPVIGEFNMDPEYLNRVMSILEDVKRHGNWQKAINDNILPRKREPECEQIAQTNVDTDRRLETCVETAAPPNHFENNLRFRRRKSF